MNGKLARIEQQEKELLDRYKKSDGQNTENSCLNNVSASQSLQDSDVNHHKSKKRKNRENHADKMKSTDIEEDCLEVQTKRKKKKRKKEKTMASDLEDIEDQSQSIMTRCDTTLADENVSLSIDRIRVDLSVVKSKGDCSENDDDANITTGGKCDIVDLEFKNLPKKCKKKKKKKDREVK